MCVCVYIYGGEILCPAVEETCRLIFLLFGCLNAIIFIDKPYTINLLHLSAIITY